LEERRGKRKREALPRTQNKGERVISRVMAEAMVEEIRNRNMMACVLMCTV
jgi:hypothetical protein